MSGGKIILNKALRSAVNLSSSKLPSEVAKTSAQLFSALSGTKFVLPDLAYDYNALEPAISAETMEIHHSKHHQVRYAYGFKFRNCPESFFPLT
jgi:Fe-Mn family superoxide dismutase